jgi:hypothetical protein
MSAEGQPVDNGTPEATPPAKTPWYFATGFLIVMLLSVGPLALPLLWVNPRFSALSKVLWTVVTAALTWALVSMSVTTFKTVMEQYRDLGLIK